MGSVLLAAAMLLGLAMIPFGLPGLWVMAGAVLVYSYVGPPSAIGVATLVAVLVLAFFAELVEFALSGRFARRYGGSRRAGWGAILGGIVGAIVGVPIFLIGSMIGAFLGAFVGAWMAEMTLGTEVRAATRVATGALLGRIAAVAAKVGIGMVIMVWTFVAIGLASHVSGTIPR
jgi:uncharacterized protein